jgi:hypothetical protein
MAYFVPIAANYYLSARMAAARLYARGSQAGGLSSVGAGPIRS